VGILVILFLKSEWKNAIRWVALLTTIVTFAISVVMLTYFQPGNPDIQMEINIPWFQFVDWTIYFHLGVDGLSILLVMLTTLLIPISILSTWTAVQDRVKDFMIFFLLLEVGMVGVFVALDLFLFYIFWEFTLVPMYFLIGVWGGPRRMYAAVKFFLYTMAGSILMLLAILWLGIDQGTFSVTELIDNGNIPADIQFWLFIAFAAAFAIKVPMWPLHSWLPDAHVEAPTAGSVILAGVLLKMGTYGFLRLISRCSPTHRCSWLHGSQVWRPLVSCMEQQSRMHKRRQEAGGIFIGKPPGLRHVGFVCLNAQGIEGGILQMVNHGLSTGALFLIVGMIYERTHTREMDAFGGLWKVMPIYGALTLIVTLSSMGLPGLNGFVGEFTILLGAFGSEYISPWFAAISSVGIILAAIYMLFMFQKLFLGPLDKEENKFLKYINWREIITLVPLLVFIFFIGLYPKPFFTIMAPAVDKLVTIIQTAASAGLP
jgi:NADH-quinone oxidoreductase subunit M